MYGYNQDVDKVSREWAVTLIYRVPGGEVHHYHQQVEADSFWVAIGKVVDTVPVEAQELLSLTCLRI